MSRKYKIKSNLNSQGFTLVEVLMSVFIFTIIGLGVTALVSNLFTSSSAQSGLLADQDAARKTAQGIVNELRNAQTGSDGSYALALANDQEIVFFAPVAGLPGIVRVHYFLQNGNLRKGTVVYSGGAYNLGNEQIKTVQKNLSSSATIFSYFDGDFTGTQTPLVQPVSVTAVKFVKVDMNILNKAGVANTSTYTVSAGAAVRNLKTNLGD